MTTNELLAHLRSACEEDVESALLDAYVSLPIETPAQALELFIAIRDDLTGHRA